MTTPNDLAPLASSDPRERFAAEDRVRAAGAEGIAALEALIASPATPEDLRDRATDLRGTLLCESAVTAFRAAIPDPGAPDLWAGAVAIAAEAHPSLDRDGVDEGLRALVERARTAIAPADDVEGRVSRLTAWLFEDAGFRGTDHGFSDPRDSYLPDVLETRRGIPVSLSVLWMALAERLGLSAAGVGLPLHFVARCEGSAGPLFIDAFHGDVLDEDGCRRLVAKAAGRDVALPPRAFRPLRTTEVLSRMLRNLRMIHEGAGRHHMALAALDRALHLDALDGAALRDRALVFARLSRPAAAARTLARALALEPDAPDRERLESLRRRLLRAAAERN